MLKCLPYGHAVDWRALGVMAFEMLMANHRMIVMMTAQMEVMMLIMVTLWTGGHWE